MSAQQVLIDGDSKPLVTQQPSPLALVDKFAAQNISPELAKELWQIAKDVEANEARKAYAKAMNLFKRNPPKLEKNRHVKYTTQKGVTEYDHATLDSVCNQIIPALNAVGISHRYRIEPKDNLIYVTCILMHEQGHSEETTLFGLPDDSGGKNKIQAIGSTVTYLQRYTLLAATGLATEGQDDDGAGGELDDLDGRLEEIANAGDLRALMAIFKAHYEAAMKAQDGRALIRIDQAKNKRKEELEA